MAGQAANAEDAVSLHDRAKRKCPKLVINRALIPLKALFFLQLAGVASLIIYITLYMEVVLGLTKSEIAVTSCLAPFIGFLSRPMFGAIADRFKAFRLILVFLLISNGFSFTMLLSIPPPSSPATNDSVSHLGNSSVSHLGNATFASQVTWSAPFLQALAWRCLGYLFYTPIICLGDAITLAHLGDEKRSEFGKTRLFGSLGFLVFSLLTSAAIRVSSDKFVPPFVMYGVLTVLSLLVLLPMRIPAEVRCSDNLWRSLRLMWMSADMCVLFVFSLLSGVCLSMIEHYVFIGVSKLVAPKKSFFGIMAAFMVVSETPLMFMSGYFIRKIGEIHCICIGFFFWAVRFGVYSVMSSEWHVLLNEMLHGITFGLILPSLVTFAHRLSPRGVEGTVQGLVSGVHFGLGVSIGGLVGGVLLEWVGFRIFFRIWSLYSVVCGASLFLVNRVLLLRASRKRQKEPDKADVKLAEVDAVVP